MKKFIFLSFFLSFSAAAIASDEPAVSEQKRLELDCKFGGAALGVSFKTGVCRAKSDQEVRYRVNFLGFGLSAGAEGGKLKVVCLVNADDHFSGLYWGSAIYGYAGNAVEWRKGQVAEFYSSNQSSCLIYSTAYGVISESGGGALELVRLQ